MCSDQDNKTLSPLRFPPSRPRVLIPKRKQCRDALSPVSNTAHAELSQHTEDMHHCLTTKNKRWQVAGELF